ncbi:glycosyltransferase [Paracoccus zhejiangensis]
MTKRQIDQQHVGIRQTRGSKGQIGGNIGGASTIGNRADAKAAPALSVHFLKKPRAQDRETGRDFQLFTLGPAQGLAAAGRGDGRGGLGVVARVVALCQIRNSPKRASEKPYSPTEAHANVWHMKITTANAEKAINIPRATNNPAMVAAIVIGRNEGERLVACLTSLQGLADPVIYVDSGSTDGSIDAARRLGAQVLVLDTSIPFTAARARNTGLRHLLDQGQQQGFVQFVDGDCQIEPGWIETARAALTDDPQLGIVAGRRRERHPEASVYNRLCDAEWNTPVGAATAVGGDMMARIEALAAIGGYRDDMIAGEEPEMCLRLRQSGMTVRRLDAPMTIHDANMHRFGQWWRRARRAGHAFAEGSWLHRNDAEPFWRRETRRALIWALVIPALILIAAQLFGSWAFLALMVYPLQVARMARREESDNDSRLRAVFLMLSKFPEAMGISEFHLRRLLGRKAGLIEYK